MKMRLIGFLYKGIEFPIFAVKCLIVFALILLIVLAPIAFMHFLISCLLFGLSSFTDPMSLWTVSWLAYFGVLLGGLGVLQLGLVVVHNLLDRLLDDE